MKNILFSFLALFTVAPAFASGKFVVTPRYYEFGKVGGQLGLSIYEPLVAGLAFNAWGGLGIRPFEFKKTEYWMSSSIGLDYQVGSIIMGVGVQPQMSLSGEESESNIFLKVGKRLW